MTTGIDAAPTVAGILVGGVVGRRNQNHGGHRGKAGYDKPRAVVAQAVRHRVRRAAAAPVHRPRRSRAGSGPQPAGPAPRRPGRPRHRPCSTPAARASHSQSGPPPIVGRAVTLTTGCVASAIPCGAGCPCRSRNALSGSGRAGAGPSGDVASSGPLSAPDRPGHPFRSRSERPSLPGLPEQSVPTRDRRVRTPLCTHRPIRQSPQGSSWRARRRGTGRETDACRYGGQEAHECRARRLVHGRRHGGSGSAEREGLAQPRDRSTARCQLSYSASRSAGSMAGSHCPARCQLRRSTSRSGQ